MNTVGRVACGWISDHPRVDALFINNAAIIMAGVASIASPSFQSYEMLMAYAVVFGMAIGSYILHCVFSFQSHAHVIYHDAVD